ncbi:MAG: SMC-Scp complex subunit ScpB [Candidatus Omnitrophota bacterium]|nr:SMC-Scp complex subunit ScpB [Candidatus Omnitrophota bacterium]
MNAKEAQMREKEREEKLKNIRRELEEKLMEQLPPELLAHATKVEVEKADSESLTPEKAKKVVEALLFASSKPMTTNEIRRVMKNFTPVQIQKMISEIRDEYDQSERSFAVYEIAGGYEIATRKEYAPWICKVELQKKARQATQSALETLSILAYKQPVTRAEIEELRGVDASGVLQNLQARSLVRIVGRKEIPGRPFLYGTTPQFLEHFGLRDISDLPNIDEIRNLVENSVRKEDLLGTEKLVDVPSDDEEATAGEAEEPAVQESGKND